MNFGREFDLFMSTGSRQIGIGGACDPVTGDTGRVRGTEIAVRPTIHDHVFLRSVDRGRPTAVRAGDGWGVPELASENRHTHKRYGGVFRSSKRVRIRL